MEQIGQSSLYCEKYRPSKINDIILPAKYKNLIENIIKQGETPNLLLSGSAGIGKTTLAKIIGIELKSDVLFINASVENGIDTVRYKVQQFASTSSFSDSKKIVILDEMERLGGSNGSTGAQDALKGIIESTDKNCMFIFTTNNLSKIIYALKSRTQLIDFSFTKIDIQEIIIQYFKRCCYILDNENIKYDKKILADFIKKLYPDFRKILNEIQKAVSMFGCIDKQVFSISSDAVLDNLLTALKNKKFFDVQKIINQLDPNDLYTLLDEKLLDLLKPECLPDITFILGEGAYRNATSTDRMIQARDTCCQIMKTAIWK